MKAVILTQRLIPVIECIFVLSSCSPIRSSKTQKGTDQQSVRVVDKVPAIDTWKPKLASGNGHYLIKDSTTISIPDDSSHSSSIYRTTIYDLTLALLSDSLSLTARVESLTTYSRLQIARLDLRTNLIEDFHATISSNGRLSPITADLPSLCVIGVSPVATRILELAVNYPQRQLKVGDKWTDTVSTTLCRGKIALQQQNTYQYEIINFSTQNGSNLVQIQRIANTTFHSLSTNMRNELTTTGSGSSSSVLYINQKTGMLIRSSAHSQVTLTINTTRGSYPFTQNTLTQIELH